MVRGRRARVNDTASSTTTTVTRTINGSYLVDDHFCASPKRKDCKIDNVTKNISSRTYKPNDSSIKLTTSSEDITKSSPYELQGAKTRSRTLKNFFKTDKIDKANLNGTDNIYINGKRIGNNVLDTRTSSSSCIDLAEDDTCDEIFDYNIDTVKQNGVAFITDIKTNTTNNIFLQEPVLRLNVDKSLNQPSSIKINKTFEIDPPFTPNGYHHNLNGQFNKIVTLSNSPKLESASSSSSSSIISSSSTTISSATTITPTIIASMLLNHDSNSCDSGVVIDNKVELSPSRRRKPTTPHRILCPSPVKHASIEKSPSVSFVGYSVMGSSTSIGFLNGVQKKNSKTRRRLNTTQSENNSSIKSPQLIGGITVSNETLKKINNFNNLSQKSILNSAINPTAEQNTNNNYKKRTNGQHHQRHKNQNVSNNKELTDYFPVRRSIRKTERAVQEEIMRSIEKAILEGREDGLKVVEHFEGKGRGVVAERIFQRGEFVVEYIGDLITTAEANQREKKYSLDENAGCYMYYFKHKNKQYCIDATAESGKLGRLVNHSRNGNLITKVVVVKNRPHLVLIAKDDIQPGEELTYDYGDRSKEALLHHPWLAL